MKTASRGSYKRSVNEEENMLRPIGRRSLLRGSATLAVSAALAKTAWAEDPVVASAKAAVARLTGLQTQWKGPTDGPKISPGKHIVYVSYDESNDSASAWGTEITNVAAKVGWRSTTIDGRGSPELWLEAMNQAIALNADGIAICADAASLQQPITTANQRGIIVMGVHAADSTGPVPKLGLFCNIAEDPESIGRAEADWVIANSNGLARAVVTAADEFAIAQRKAHATQARLQECKTVQVLEFSSTPIAEAPQRQPQLITAWVQKYGVPLYVTSIADYMLDFQVPALHSGGVDPSKVILVGSDGQKSAYERIRAGNQYQQVTVPEPYSLEAYQVIDEFNRAFNKLPPSGFVPEPYLVTHENIDTQGGVDDVFIPANGFAQLYQKFWGVA
jgi:ribose transport system substrate-binding protein